MEWSKKGSSHFLPHETDRFVNHAYSVGKIYACTASSLLSPEHLAGEVQECHLELVSQSKFQFSS